MKGFIAATIRMTRQFRDVELTRPLHVALSFDEEIGCIGVRDALVVIRRARRRIAGSRGDRRTDDDATAPQSHGQARLRDRVHCRGGALQPVAQQAGRDRIGRRDSWSCSTDLQAAIPTRRRCSRRSSVTFNCGTIAGGSALNVIAPACTFTFEVRHTVDHDPDAVLRPFWQAIDRERATLASAGRFGGALTEITRYPGLRTAADDAWLQVVERIADSGPGNIDRIRDRGRAVRGSARHLRGHLRSGRHRGRSSSRRVRQRRPAACAANDSSAVSSNRSVSTPLSRARPTKWRTRCLPMTLPPINCSPRSRSSARCGVSAWLSTIRTPRFRTRTWPRRQRPGSTG